jgi:3-oxoacyl-[acyl-carrier-protein] synthase-1
MQMAIANVGEKIDYINPHATSTPVGTFQINAIRGVFGDNMPRSAPQIADRSQPGRGWRA